MLRQVIKVAQFTSGERITIVNQIRAVAIQRGLPDLVALADRSLDHDRQTRELDTRWAERPKYRMYIPKVTAIDNTVDPVLVSVRDIATSQIRGLPAGHPLIARVQGMLDDIFPAGVVAITSLPYVDQVAATEVVVHRLQTVHAALCAELGLTARLAYLAELAVEYRQAVDTGRDLTFAQVSEMRAQGQQLLRELLAVIAGQFHDAQDPAQAEALAEFLHPLVRETELSRVRRSRGRTGDEPLDDDDQLPESPDDSPQEEDPASANPQAPENLAMTTDAIA